MNEWNFSLEVIPAPVNFLTYTFACKVSRYSKTRNIGLIIKETHVETKGILKIKFIRTDTQSLIMITFRFMTTLLSRRQVEFNQFGISSVGIRRRDVKTRSQKLIYNWTTFNFVYCTSAKNLYGHNFLRALKFMNFHKTRMSEYQFSLITECIFGGTQY